MVLLEASNEIFKASRAFLAVPAAVFKASSSGLALDASSAYLSASSALVKSSPKTFYPS